MKKIFSFIICLLLCVNFLSAQHLKKDGTPDRRYKENKETYSAPAYSSPTYASSNSTSSNSEKHLKKDGTPDMRYKENKETYPSNTTITAVPRYDSKTNYSYIVKRNSKGKIIRSGAATYEFKKQTGYPKGRSGYVIDHKIPLKKGGCDCPENMQWQTIEEAKAKDKWE